MNQQHIVDDDEPLPGASSANRPEIVSVRARKPSEGAKVGLGLRHVPGDGHVTVSRIDPSSIFFGTPVAVGDELLSINGENCVGRDIQFVSGRMRDAPDVVALVVQNPDGVPGVASHTIVEAEAEVAAAGIGFAKVGDGSGGVLRVSRIDPGGPFAGGSHPLLPGAECVSINGEDCVGLAVGDCERLLRSSFGPVTIATREDNSTAGIHEPAAAAAAGVPFEKDPIAESVPVEKPAKSSVAVPVGSEDGSAAVVPATAKPPTTTNCWSKRSKNQRFGIIAVVVAVLVGVGVGVGLTVGKGSDSDEKSDSANSNGNASTRSAGGGGGVSSDTLQLAKENGFDHVWSGNEGWVVGSSFSGTGTLPYENVFGAAGLEECLEACAGVDATSGFFSDDVPNGEGNDCICDLATDCREPDPGSYDPGSTSVVFSTVPMPAVCDGTYCDFFPDDGWCDADGTDTGNDGDDKGRESNSGTPASPTPAASPTSPVPSPTGSGPSPTATGPSPTATGPAPTGSGPAPTGSGPSPTATGPAPTPTATSPSPTGSGPAPTATGPAPTGSGPSPTATTPSTTPPTPTPAAPTPTNASPPTSPTSGKTELPTAPPPTNPTSLIGNFPLSCDPGDDSCSWNSLGFVRGPSSGSRGGFSVAMDRTGKIMAVGSPVHDGSRGAVRAYYWSGSSWRSRGARLAYSFADTYFGIAVALSGDGDVLAAAASGSDYAGTDSGLVRTYRWNGSAYLFEANVAAGANDNLGRNLALDDDGTVLAIGADGHDGIASDSEAARVHRWTGSAWVLKGNPIPVGNYGAAAGYSVAVTPDGSTVAIGNFYNDDNGANSGNVTVYDFKDSDWDPRYQNLEGSAAGDRFGYSLALSDDGTRIAVGAPQDAVTAKGYVKIYVDSGWWLESETIVGTQAGEAFGASVDLDGDGKTLVVGVDGYDYSSSATNSGQVRVYSRESGAWIPMGSPIDAFTTDDWLGFPVAINADGDVILAGESGDNGMGTDRGVARVYHWGQPASVTDGDSRMLARERDVIAS